MRDAQQVIEGLGRLQAIDRSFLTNFVFGPEDIVVVLGQDGLVANTVKYLRWPAGHWRKPRPGEVGWTASAVPRCAISPEFLLEVIERRRPTKAVTMAKATLNTGQVMHGVNDIFIGPRSHGSARYSINVGGQTNNQSVEWRHCLYRRRLYWLAQEPVDRGSGHRAERWLPSRPKGPGHIGSPAFTPNAEARRSDNVLSPGVSSLGRGLPLLHRSAKPFPSKTTQASIVFGRITG